MSSACLRQAKMRAAQREEEPPAFAALKELIPLFPETKQFLQKVRSLGWPRFFKDFICASLNLHMDLS